MRLNGWQSAWIVLSAIWTVFFIWGVLPITYLLGCTKVQNCLFSLGPPLIVWWILPPFLLYGLGMTVYWVRRRFSLASAGTPPKVREYLIFGVVALTLGIIVVAVASLLIVQWTGLQ
jgi:hypothetical protein